jgi:chromosome segregation ATPase
MERNKKKREGMLPAHIFEKQKKKNSRLDKLKDIYPALNSDKNKAIDPEIVESHKNLKKQYDQLEKQYSDLQEQHECLQEEHDNLLMRFDEKIGSRKELLKTIENLKKEKNSELEKLENLEKENNSLKVDIEDLLNNKKVDSNGNSSEG